MSHCRTHTRSWRFCDLCGAKTREHRRRDVARRRELAVVRTPIYLEGRRCGACVRAVGAEPLARLPVAPYRPSVWENQWILRHPDWHQVALDCRMRRGNPLSVPNRRAHQRFRQTWPRGLRDPWALALELKEGA